MDNSNFDCFYNFEILPDHLVPILLKRELLASENPVGLTSTHSIQADNLSEKLKTDGTSKMKVTQQYRKRVKEFLEDHELTPVEAFQLATLANVLGLSESEANKILEEEQNQIKPISESSEELSLSSQSTPAISNLTSLQKAKFQKWGMLASGAILFSLLSAVVVNYSWQQSPQPPAKPNQVTLTPTSVDPGILGDYEIRIYFLSNRTDLKTKANEIQALFSSDFREKHISLLPQTSGFFTQYAYPKPDISPSGNELRYTPENAKGAKRLQEILKTKFPGERFSLLPIGSASGKYVSIFLGP